MHPLLALSRRRRCGGIVRPLPPHRGGGAGALGFLEFSFWPESRTLIGGRLRRPPIFVWRRPLMADVKKAIRRTVRNLKQTAMDKGEDVMASISKSVKKKAKPMIKDAKKAAKSMAKDVEKAAEKKMKQVKKAARPALKDLKKGAAKTTAKAAAGGAKLAAKGAKLAAEAKVGLSKGVKEARKVLRKGLKKASKAV